MKECPICHTLNDDESETCNNCHSSLSFKIYNATQIDTTESDKSTSKKTLDNNIDEIKHCAHCGTKISKDDVLCKKCSRKDGSYLSVLSAMCNQFFVALSEILPLVLLSLALNLNCDLVGIISLILVCIVWGLTVNLELIFTPYIFGAILWIVSLLLILISSNNQLVVITTIISFIIWCLMGLVYYLSLVKEYLE